MTCKGCAYEWKWSGEMRCALGERHGVRCSKWPGKEGKKK